MKIMYIDCGMGCAGDMLMAALLELHPDRAAFLERINAALAGKAEIRTESVEKCGIKCTSARVITSCGEEAHHDGTHAHHDHGHVHHHGHSHASVKDIMAFIDSVQLEERVKEHAREVYKLLAQAEGSVHGKDMDNIHFHEVGSLDALADVLSVCALVCELAPERIIASPVNVGSGTVKCAHGVLPVPAPATELLLRGVPIYSGDVKAELCTPTGAALLKHFVDDYGRMPLMRVRDVGYGAGTKDFETVNVVRVLVGEA